MRYAVELIKFVDGQAAPVVVRCINGRFSTVAQAKEQAIVLFATRRSMGEAIGYRIVEDDDHVVTTIIQGIG
jgi:hypothetical protein